MPLEQELLLAWLPDSTVGEPAAHELQLRLLCALAVAQPELLPQQMEFFALPERAKPKEHGKAQKGVSALRLKPAGVLP